MDETKFLQQTEQLPYEHADNILEIGDFIDLLAGMEGRRTDLRTKPRSSPGWLPSEWLTFLDRVHYKPGWHGEVSVRAEFGEPILQLRVWTHTLHPDRGGMLQTVAQQAICPQFITDDTQAEHCLFRLIRQVEDLLCTTWFRVDPA